MQRPMQTGREEYQPGCQHDAGNKRIRVRDGSRIVARTGLKVSQDQGRSRGATSTATAVAQRCQRPEVQALAGSIPSLSRHGSLQHCRRRSGDMLKPLAVQQADSNISAPTAVTVVCSGVRGGANRVESFGAWRAQSLGGALGRGMGRFATLRRALDETLLTEPGV